MFEDCLHCGADVIDGYPLCAACATRYHMPGRIAMGANCIHCDALAAKRADSFAEMTTFALSIGCWQCGEWTTYDDAPHPLTARRADFHAYLTTRGWSETEQGHWLCPYC